MTGVACPAGTVLGWHNHIYANVKAYFEGEGWPVTGETSQACYLSPVDLRNGLWTVQKVYGEVVQVDSKTFCWWFTSQLAAIPKELYIFVRAIPTQLRSDWGAREREQVHETQR